MVLLVQARPFERDGGAIQLDMRRPGSIHPSLGRLEGLLRQRHCTLIEQGLLLQRSDRDEPPCDLGQHIELRRLPGAGQRVAPCPGHGNARFPLAAQFDDLRQRERGFGRLQPLCFAGTQEILEAGLGDQCGLECRLVANGIRCPEFELEDPQVRVGVERSGNGLAQPECWRRRGADGD